MAHQGLSPPARHSGHQTRLHLPGETNDFQPRKGPRGVLVHHRMGTSSLLVRVEVSCPSHVPIEGPAVPVHPELRGFLGQGTSTLKQAKCWTNQDKMDILVHAPAWKIDSSTQFTSWNKAPR